jgi:hypothetical protein
MTDGAKDDGSWTVAAILKELRATADRIEGHRLSVSAEERQTLLPLLIILKRLTKRKKPGFHDSLASIGLNASTVRSWFYRGYHTDEIIAMLEPEPKTEDESPGSTANESVDQHSLSSTEECLQKADKLAAAVLKKNFELATRLAKGYTDLRKKMIGSDAHQWLKKKAA